MFTKKLFKAFINLIKITLLLGILFLGFIHRDKILSYILHSQSFYEVYLGDEEYKKKNYQKAIEHYIKALELYPEHTKARYNLANIYVVYEDFPAAVEEYKTALKHDPDYINARINLGIVLAEELLELDQAIEQYQLAANSKVEPVNIPFVYDNREQLKYAKAIAYYDMGLAYRDKSMLYQKKAPEYRNLLLKAVESYEKSLEINPDNYDAQYNYALTAHLLGLVSDAITGYCRAILLAPLNYEAHYNLGVLLRQRNNFKEAYEEFKDVGALMVYSGDSFKAAHVYMMLNEVSKRAVEEYGVMEEKMLYQMEELGTNELESAIKKRIRTASICKNYLTGN